MRFLFVWKFSQLQNNFAIEYFVSLSLNTNDWIEFCEYLNKVSRVNIIKKEKFYVVKQKWIFLFY